MQKRSQESECHACQGSNALLLATFLSLGIGAASKGLKTVQHSLSIAETSPAEMEARVQKIRNMSEEMAQASYQSQKVRALEEEGLPVHTMDVNSQWNQRNAKLPDLLAAMSRLEIQDVQDILGEIHAVIRILKHRFSLYMYDHGKYQEALDSRNNVLEIIERTKGKSSLNATHDMSATTVILSKIGQHDKAVGLSREALNIYTQFTPVGLGISGS